MSNTIEMKELYYDKESFDKVSCAISQDLILSMRKDMKSNCVGAAETLAEMFRSSGIIATCIMFKSRGNAFLNPLTVFNELTNENNIYTHHTIVLFGDCCMDLLHSDRIIPIKEYIEKLELLNVNGIRLDSSSMMYNANGFLYCPTLEDLKNYTC